MKTDYYCKTCKQSFQEAAIPNINKRHSCGTIAKITKHDVVITDRRR